MKIAPISQLGRTINKMLPEFYQTHLAAALSAKTFYSLQLLVDLLQRVRQVKLETLAQELSLPIRAESRRKWCQRFLDLADWELETLWIPLVLCWMARQFGAGQRVYVIIDRTHWRDVNLLMVTVAWGKRTFPVYWQLLDKAGSSNLAEQQQVLAPVLQALVDYPLVVLGDREFCGVELAGWLASQSVQFCLRLKRNEAVEVSPGHWQTTLSLAIKPGTSRFFPDIKLTKKKGFGRHRLAIKWQRDYAGFASDEPWLLLTNLPDLETALNAYAKRFRIEEMFRDWKLGGDCLEATMLRGQRLLSLILMIAIAYTSAAIKGRRCHHQRLKPYVSRGVSEPHRRYPRHTHAYVGRSALIWSHCLGRISDTVLALLQLNPNKRRFYHQGFKAMMTVQQDF